MICFAGVTALIVGGLTTNSTVLLVLVQALDDDQGGPTVVLKKLFEEDREFNQGTHAVIPFCNDKLHVPCAI